MREEPAGRRRAGFRILCKLILGGALAWTVLQPPHSAAAAEPRLVIFDLELLDTSLEGEVSGENAAEQDRLAMASDLLRQLVADSERFQLVDIEPARERIAEVGHLRSCNGCDAAIARDLGAEQALSGVIQKVSNLILNINLYLRDAGSGTLLKVMSADIRGNTDESWAHGISWLVRNRLLK